MSDVQLFSPKQLYHVCPTWLEVGSIIRPGNWGRVVDMAGVQHPNWKREQVLERMRQVDFPHKPSRMSAVFVCGDIRAARMFHQSSRKWALIYEVETTEDSRSLNWHAGDFNYCIEGHPDYTDIPKASHLYWTGIKVILKNVPGVYCTEWIAKTNLKILREVA
jgi:hypothetical protein